MVGQVLGASNPVNPDWGTINKWNRGGERSSGSSSSFGFPVLMNSPQSDWSLQLSQLLNQIGQEQYGWAKDQITRNQPITDANIARFLDMSQRGTGLADDLTSQYRDTFMPMMDRYARDANLYSSEGRKRYEAGKAESTVAQAAGAARDAAERKLQGFGVNPNSGRYQDLDLTTRVQDAAARAGAGTQAAFNTDMAGRQLQQNALQLGQNLPGMAVNALQSGYQGVTGAQNALLGGMAANNQTMGLPAAYWNASANALKLPPVGNYQMAQSQQQSFQADGGPVPSRGVIPSPTTGGFVGRDRSPSQGRQTDDIPARLNADEYVIPRDVVHFKGKQFFDKLIEQSRKARTGMAGPAPRPTQKPALRMNPTFVSHRI